MAAALDPLELVLHPLRARILGHIGRGQATAAALCESLGDVSLATLYRHIALLEEGGILRVASERRVRGTIERTLEVNPDAAFLPDPEHATRADLMRCVGVFASSLVGDFDRYLGEGTLPDFAVDGVVFDTLDLALDDAEFASLGRALQEALAAVAANELEDGRKLRRLSIAIMPAAES